MNADPSDMPMRPPPRRGAEKRAAFQPERGEEEGAGSGLETEKSQIP